MCSDNTPLLTLRRTKRCSGAGGGVNGRVFAECQGLGLLWLCWTLVKSESPCNSASHLASSPLSGWVTFGKLPNLSAPHRATVRIVKDGWGQGEVVGRIMAPKTPVSRLLQSAAVALYEKQLECSHSPPPPPTPRPKGNLGCWSSGTSTFSCLRQNFTELVTHTGGWIGWLPSTRDRPVSISARLGLEAHTIMPSFFFLMWVLRSKRRPLCQQGKYFTA